MDRKRSPNIAAVLYVIIYIYIEEERDAVGQRKIHKEKLRSAFLSWPSGLAVTICDNRAARH